MITLTDNDYSKKQALLRLQIKDAIKVYYLLKVKRLNELLSAKAQLEREAKRKRNGK
jgi:hypothetical protein